MEKVGGKDWQKNVHNKSRSNVCQSQKLTALSVGGSRGSHSASFDTFSSCQTCFLTPTPCVPLAPAGTTPSAWAPVSSYLVFPAGLAFHRPLASLAFSELEEVNCCPFLIFRRGKAAIKNPQHWQQRPDGLEVSTLDSRQPSASSRRGSRRHTGPGLWAAILGWGGERLPKVWLGSSGGNETGRLFCQC